MIAISETNLLYLAFDAIAISRSEARNNPEITKTLNINMLTTLFPNT
jgi:hypothetical protein